MYNPFMSKEAEQLLKAGGLFVSESGPVAPRTIEKPVLHKRIVWMEGQEGKIAQFPHQPDFPAKAAFSWGNDAMKQMMLSSEMYTQLVKGDSHRTENAIYRFLQEAGLNPERSETTRVAPFIKRRGGGSSEVLEITPDVQLAHKETITDDGAQNLATGADIIYTRMLEVPLVVMPADCPSAVIMGYDKRQKPVLAVAHWGRDEVESLSPAKSIGLMQSLGCDARNLQILLTPGISPENYYIRAEDVEGLLPNLKRWGEHAEKASIPNPQNSWQKTTIDVVKLDILGRIVEQIQDFGVSGPQIHAYDVDTYAQAAEGHTYSHRYAAVSRSKKYDGRFILAAQLTRNVS